MIFDLKKNIYCYANIQLLLGNGD